MRLGKEPWDIVVGMGEIGKSIKRVLEEGIEVQTYDVSWGEKELLVQVSNQMREYSRVLHVCFPYSDNFVAEVEKYQRLFKPKYTVIHSTVPVGTSKKCKAIHSPVVGIHPHLEKSLKTFTKFFGGEGASEVADLFRRGGVNVYVTDKAETTELMKILCTTNYALNIEFTKEVKRLCDKNKVPFEIFTIWNDNYNKGYEELGYPEYHRYNLVPLMKKIGGHCLLPNLELLKSKFTEFLKKL